MKTQIVELANGARYVRRGLIVATSGAALNGLLAGYRGAAAVRDWQRVTDSKLAGVSDELFVSAEFDAVHGCRRFAFVTTRDAWQRQPELRAGALEALHAVDGEAGARVYDLPELTRTERKLAAIRTTYHAYSFDIARPEERAQWEALQAQMKKAGARMFGPVHGSYFDRRLDGQAIELETAHLFDNQWNTAPIEGVSEKGLRVFDFALESECSAGSRFIRRGHWLDQTAEMREIRRNTNACGYCGKQEPAPKGNVFCPHCIDSEYLKPDELHLTRMRAVDDQTPRARLTEAERAHLLPLYREAQVHATTERGKARQVATRRRVAKAFESKVRHATQEHDGITWLLDHGVNTDNVIYYSHSNNGQGLFSFGWRTPLSEGVRDEILNVISEFSFPYELKCDDGRTLNGNIG